jgi:hypothetical protein
MAELGVGWFPNEILGFCGRRAFQPTLVLSGCAVCESPKELQVSNPFLSLLSDEISKWPVVAMGNTFLSSAGIRIIRTSRSCGVLGTVLSIYVQSCSQRVTVSQGKMYPSFSGSL